MMTPRTLPRAGDGPPRAASQRAGRHTRRAGARDCTTSRHLLPRKWMLIMFFDLTQKVLAGVVVLLVILGLHYHAF